jgi:flagellin-like hook-associated protein FlgL
VWWVDNMRVTFNTFNYRNLDNINRDLNNVVDANEKVSKGRNLLYPETDPVRYSNAVNTQRTINEAKQFTRNAENSIFWVDNSTNELNGVHNILSTIRNDKSIEALNVSQSAESRAVIAKEVDAAMKQIYAHANAKYNDKYIFAGSKTNQQPFVKGDRNISIVSNSGNFKLIQSKVYKDINELTEGYYTASIEKTKDGAKLILKDQNGKTVNIDSNGSDESGTSYNYISNELIGPFKGNNVINTGVGVSIKLPENFKNGEVRFYYKPGYKVTYQGDSREIINDIGYHQELSLNTPGEGLFTASKRTLEGSNVMLENGLPVNYKTEFLNIDNSRVTLGDSIYINGVDHNGLTIGAATINSQKEAQLDLTGTSEKDRTLTIGYGDYTYNVAADAAAYKDINELIDNLNEKLNDQGLSEELQFRSNGERILLTTKRGGNAVYLSVEGAQRGLLGFADKKLESYGKDISYEIGDKNEVNKAILEPLSINKKMAFEAGKTTTMNINGNTLEVQPDLDGNGKIDEKEVENAIKKAFDGLDNSLKFTYNVDVEKERGDFYNVKFTLRNTNYDRQTHLTLSYTDARNNSDYAVKFYRQNNYPLNYEDNLGSFTGYLNDLLDNNTNIRLDNGKLVIEDKRGGKSNLNVNIVEQNEGVNQFLNPDVQLIGSYTGNVDTNLDITIRNNKLNVKDSMGRNIINNFDLNDYNGEYIPIGNGLSLLIKDKKNTHLNVHLNDGNKLEFGDMQRVTEGGGEDVFFIFQNIKDALEYNIMEYGVSEPSAWQSKDYKSEAKPFLDGDFKGNYNDKWVFRPVENEGLNKFYLQEALEYNLTGVVDDSVFDGNKENIDFDIIIKDGNKAAKTLHIDDQFSSIDDIINKMNEELVNYNSEAFYEDGHIKVKTPGNTNIAIYANKKNTANLLGFSNGNDDDLKNTIVASENTELHLSNKSDEERTINLDILKNKGEDTYSIILEQKDYNSIDEIVNYINTLDDLPDGVKATNIDGRLAFTFSNNVKGLLAKSVSDKEYTGFKRIGDTLKIDVTNDKGEEINEIEIDTAGKNYMVADGVTVGFDEGVIYANDSFTAAVGSGLRYELDKLSTVDNKVLTTLTELGTKRNRIDATVNFNDVLNESNEDIKATQLGSQPIDAVAAATELQRASQAYQAAMSATTMNNQLSILNFLR